MPSLPITPASRRSPLRRSFFVMCLPAAALVFALTGCIAVENDHNAEDPSIRPTRVWYAQDAQTTDALVIADAPATSSLDRSGWVAAPYVAVDGRVAHAPTYAPEYDLWSMDEHRGTTTPTRVTSLMGDTQTNTNQAKSAFAAPALAAFDLIALLPRMVIEQPWTTVHSPVEAVASPEGSASAHRADIIEPDKAAAQTHREPPA